MDQKKIWTNMERYFYPEVRIPKTSFQIDA